MENIKLSKLQENKFTMFTDVENILESNSAIITGIPQFVHSFDGFKNVISAIQLKAIRKGTVSAGKTLAKSMKRVELETVIIELSSALFAYGSKKGDEIIKALSNISPTNLDRLRDTEVPNKAEALLNTIEDNKAELAAFGIGDEDITRLRNGITTYKTTSNEKSISHTEKTVITGSLTELFKNGMDILENEIDKLINSRRAKDTDFYRSYYAVRSIKNTGVRHKKETEPVNKPAQ